MTKRSHFRQFKSWILPFLFTINNILQYTALHSNAFAMRLMDFDPFLRSYTFVIKSHMSYNPFIIIKITVSFYIFNLWKNLNFPWNWVIYKITICKMNVSKKTSKTYTGSADNPWQILLLVYSITCLQLS